MIVLLWTDALVFLLVAIIAGCAWFVRGQPHLMVSWRRVMQSAYGVSALIVLAVFVIIGLADSIHYRPVLQAQKGQTAAGQSKAYAAEVLSLLDTAAQPLRSRVERTYSAPFATRAYQRETTERPGADGKTEQVREYPRLAHGGIHLANEEDRDRDVFIRSLRAIVLALVAWLALAGLVAFWQGHRRGTRTGVAWRAIWRGETAVPWHAALVTIAVLMVLASLVLALSTPYHVLGTDKVGRDVLYLSLKSIRTGLVIGTLTTLVLLPFAVGLGIMAGYFRGWIDDVIQYIYTTLNSIPGVLLIAASVLLMQVYVDQHPELFPTAAQRADLRLLFLCVILGLTSWTGLARLLRGEALKLRELEYVQAAQAFGVKSGRILTRHIIPNVMHIILISLVMDFSGLVLAEAVLSYVGVGVDPTMTSFGTMINQARLEMGRDPMVWWSLAAAFAFMFVLVLAANLFADAVRDAFDPRVRVGSRASLAAAAVTSK